MKFAKQKQIEKELDELFPKKKGDIEHNILRSKYNAMRLHGDSNSKSPQFWNSFF